MSAESFDRRPAAQDGGENSLRGLAALAGGLGSERVREEALALAARIAEGCFYVACIGQFSERGFRTRSRFTFEHLFRVSLPASPLRYLADTFLGLADASSHIEREAREFLDQLIEMNSSRVQSDLLNRVQESREQLEVEIRKLLHEVARVGESALEHARAAQAQGAPAVEAALARLNSAESQIHELQPPVESGPGSM